uniref:Centromere protein X n=1 Tax=Cyclopterus lumpus TaxID=8103 RepID=A0A8C2ZUA0_CYCLU
CLNISTISKQFYLPLSGLTDLCLSVTVSGDATLLMTELLKIFVQEAAVRSLKQAESEDCDRVDVEHFEKILPQLLLDF